jgi:hypothetical protein
LPGRRQEHHDARRLRLERGVRKGGAKTLVGRLLPAREGLPGSDTKRARPS